MSSSEATLQRFRESNLEKLSNGLPGKSWEKHNIMSSSKRKRLGAEKEAGPSSPWKKYGLDIDTLECPVCTEPFSRPVFQCDNGHAACSKCCQKMNTRRCPSCSLPIGRIRCLAIEKVIESMWVECELGCATKLRLRNRDEHEKNLCKYRLVKCPTHGCTHSGSMCAISDHLLGVHDIPTAEWCESTRSASFDMGDSADTAVLVKAKEALLLVSLLALPHEEAHRFTCESGWALTSKEVLFKLTVKKAFPQLHKRVYSMEGNLTPRDLDEFLFIPGHTLKPELFNVTVSLTA